MNLPLRQSTNSPGVIIDASEQRFAIIHGPMAIKFAAEIVQVCNAYPALLAACKRAEQTFRNLANSGGIVQMGTSMEIARNELANLRAAIAQVEQ